MIADALTRFVSHRLHHVVHRLTEPTHQADWGAIPGPPRRSPLGHLPALLKEPQPWVTLQRLERRFGPIALVWLGTQPAIVLHHPEGIEEVLVSNRIAYSKKEPVEALRPIVTDSNPFIARGADWKQKRQHSFFCHGGFGQWLEANADQVMRDFDLAFDTLAGLPGDRERFALTLQRIVFDILSRLLVGDVFDDRLYRDFELVMRTGDLRMKTNLPLFLPGFRAARKAWFEAFDRHLEVASEGKALIHQLREGSALTREHFRAELANVFPGGLFSITGALANALVQSAQHPGLSRDLRAALLEAWRSGAPTYSQLSQLLPLEAFLRETLRLHPPAPILSRAVRAPSVFLREHRIPRDTRILISPLPLHLCPHTWREPQSFSPQRWGLETLKLRNYGSSHFFPFGRGPRACLGQHLALYVLRLGLASFARRFQLELGPSPRKQRYFFACMPPQFSGQIQRLQTA